MARLPYLSDWWGDYYQPAGALVRVHVRGRKLADHELVAQSPEAVCYATATSRLRVRRVCGFRVDGELCSQPRIWNGAQWVCLVGHIVAGNYNEDGLHMGGRPSSLVLNEVDRRDIRPDNWYAEETSLFRVPAASNWPHGRIRTVVDRRREGAVDGSLWRRRPIWVKDR